MRKPWPIPLVGLARLAAFASLLLGFATSGAACVPSLEGNEAREPTLRPPATFGPRPGATSEAARTWDAFFADPNLRALVEAALAGNRELAASVQEVVIARAEVSARGGELYPKVGASARVGVDKVGKTTSQGRSDEAHGVPEHLGDFGFGLQGTWEVDVWGKLRNARDAADARYLASVEARRFLVTQVVAEIARSYWELLALDAQTAILQRNLEVQKNALESVRVEKLAARVTELAVQRFEAEVLKNESRLYDLEQERVRAENRINFLVGRFPQPVTRDPRAFDAPLPHEVAVGLPSELLDNRPDVRQAALELSAAKLDVKAAKKAFYPSLAIDAQAGYRAFNAAHLVATPDSLAYGAAAGLTAPLLNRAAITAQYRSANARQVQAVLHYEQTVLQAFTDVANQLATVTNLERGYELQERQVETLGRSVDISKVLFQSARADYVEVLLTRRDALDAELELVETRRRRLVALVGVYQALGGGWRGPAKSGG